MPVYDYVCKGGCGSHFQWATREGHRTRCPACETGTVMRQWGFRMAPVMHAHLNHTTGTVVSDPRQFERDLRRKSEEMSERTGIPHNYVPADRNDVKKLGVTEEGLDSTYNRKVASGELEKGSKTWRL